MMIGMIAVILSLISSYHNVQLGQWELVGRQNLIIGNSNKNKLLVLLEHRKSNQITMLSGVVLVEPEYLKDRKVYGHVLAAFR